MRTNDPRVHSPVGFLFSLLLLGLCFRPVPSRADDKAARKIYEETLKSCAQVQVPLPGNRVSSGSAWIVDRTNRLLITNHHVVGNAATAFVLFPAYDKGKIITDPKHYRKAVPIRATVVDSDPKRDLAILQLDSIPDGVVQLKLAPKSAQATDQVHLIGNPGASDAFWVYTSGTVRALARKSYRYPDGQFVDTRMLETQLAGNPGDSGGPVVNQKGELVGVHASSQSGVQLMCAAVDVGIVKAFLAEVRPLLDPATATPVAYLRRGERFLDKQNIDRAILDLSQAIRLDKKLAVAYLHRGWAFARKGDLDTALIDLDQAVALDDSDDRGYNRRGVVHFRKKDYDNAIKDYTRAIRLNPHDSILHANRGDAYREKRDYKRAISNYDQAIWLNSRSASAFRGRAACHFASRDHDKAIADYVAALDIEPKDPATLNLLANVYFAIKKYEMAAALYTMAIKQNHRSPGVVWTNLGKTRVHLGKPLEAIAAFSEAIRLDPRHAEAYFGRGGVFEDHGMLGKAQADYEQAVKLDARLLKQLAYHDRSFVAVANRTRQGMKVHVEYECLTTKDEWKWGTVSVNLNSGQQVDLYDQSWRVNARKIRIWAESLDGTKRTRTQEASVVAERYLARKRATWLYSFNE